MDSLRESEIVEASMAVSFGAFTKAKATFRIEQSRCHCEWRQRVWRIKLW